MSNVLSRIGAAWAGNEQKTISSRYDSARVAEPPAVPRPLPEAELRSAVVGTLVTRFSQKSSRLLGLVDRPVPSCSAAQGGSWQSPLLQKNSSRAPEFNLLQTPLVVKKAEVLATSASGFPGFTPRSILRSSVRSTPQATPSAFPGESVTPPPRANKHRVSFKEGNSDEKWTVGVSWAVVSGFYSQRLSSLLFGLEFWTVCQNSLY
ncbi:protein ELYS-like [Tyto alba]|uniref:protein ELYS-like n=1 Tax=Tyto alba TaxID=56313 RepID=UPI001C67710F|nr:protein ELYS-like [Tyto alba]